MGKKKVEVEKAPETKERAAVSRERRLALALRAVLDATENMVLTSSTDEPLSYAALNATKVLDELGYKDLVGIPRRIAELEGQLHAAVSAGDYSTVAKLGQELDRVKAGKVHMTKKGVITGDVHTS